MKFSISASDGQTTIVATMVAATEAEARTAFEKEFNKGHQFKIKKVTGPLGYPKVRK